MLSHGMWSERKAIMDTVDYKFLMHVSLRFTEFFCYARLIFIRTLHSIRKSYRYWCLDKLLYFIFLLLVFLIVCLFSPCMQGDCIAY